MADSPIPANEAVAMGEKIKADIIARKIIPVPQSTNEHSFEITGRQAYALRDKGAKLIKKNASQNGANTTHGRVSHDAIAFTGGGDADALASAGPPANENRPVWQWTDRPHGDPSMYVDPWDMDAGTTPIPPEPIPPEPIPPKPTEPDWAKLPTVWSPSGAEKRSLLYYTEAAISLEQFYIVMLLRKADWGGAGNWMFHIIESDVSCEWMKQQFMASDEYKKLWGIK